MTHARPRAAALAVLLLQAAALAACGGSSGTDCSAQATRVHVRDLVRDWYLFTDGVDEAAFDPATSTLGAAEYLDALVGSAVVPAPGGGTAAAPDHGRHYSYLTTKAANSQFFDEGTSLGFGFGYHRVGADRLLLTQVFGTDLAPTDPLRSAAAGAGFERGDELVAVAPGVPPTPNAAELSAGARQVSAILAADAVTPGALSAAFGSGVAGTVRDFRLRKVGTGALVDVQATTKIYSLDPVPHGATPTVLTSPGGKKVGYLMLRTFINPATPLLQSAFAAWKARADVTDLIIDVRYNGGGLLDVAKVLVDLMSQGQSGALAFGLRHNAARAAGADLDYYVLAKDQSLAPTRVAFIVGPGSASASELVPFALAPALGADVALVGDRTLGKPAGQYGFSFADCPTVYVVLSFQLANRAARAEYWDGLPDPAWPGASCAADDDLAHQNGTDQEAATLAALQWIDGGQAACTPLPTAPPPARVARALEAGGPPEAELTLAQRHIPNLY